MQPSVRVFTTWTPQRLVAAEIAADAGNLAEAGRLCDWILADDRVGGTTSARTQALLGLQPSFEPAGDRRRSNRAVKALDAQEDWWAAYPESELGQILTWGYMLGVVPARHQWIEFEDHGGRILPCPEFWHPTLLRQDQLTRKWLIRAQSELGAPPVETELVPGDSTWVLHTPFGKNRPWSLGLWRGLAVWVLLKRFAIGDWARHSEKAALTSVESTIDPNATVITPEMRQELAQEVYSRGRDGVVVMPPGFTAKLVEATANTRDIYDAQIAAANTAIAIAVRGGNLTTEISQGSGGSRAAAQVQQKLGDEGRLAFDAQALTTTLHDQSLVWWAEFNFGDRKLAPWPIYPVEPEKDVLAQAQAADVAAEVVGKFEDRGFEVDREAFVEEFGLSSWLKPGKKVAPPTSSAATQKAAAQPSPSPADLAQASRQPWQLASGATASEAPGFVSGQLYADALTERSTEIGRAALKDTTAAILAELDAASGWDDLRARLQARYKDMDPERISQIVESAMVMAELAGRAGVNQDAD